MRRSYVLLLVALLALAACGSSAARTTSPSGTVRDTAKTAACNGLATIDHALASLLSINVNTTVGDVKAAQQKVTNALHTIESRVPSASGQTADQLKSANDQLTAKLQGYPDDTPIGHTSAKVQDVRATVTTAQGKAAALASQLKCSP